MLSKTIGPFTLLDASPTPVSFRDQVLAGLADSPKWLPAVPAMVIFAMALPLDIIIWIMALCYRARTI